MISLLLALHAFAFLPEHAYRLQHGGVAFLAQAAVAAGLGLLFCALTLFILLRDNRSGYPSFRCSLATLLWALACLPIFFLTWVVIGRVWK